MKFFKIFFASLLALLVGGFILLIGLSLLLTIFTMGLTSESIIEVKPKTVLKIDLVDPLVDSPSQSPLGQIDLNTMTILKYNTIYDVVRAVDYAALDPNIEGIYLNIKGGGLSLAMLEELRESITLFKGSGKFVVSYSDSYQQSNYYLSSVADKVYMNPEGQVDWRGVASNVLFYKGALDKLGVQPEIIRHGTFKSAVEPFINTEMSPANRLQTEVLVNNIWSVMLDDVAGSRGIDRSLLNEYATKYINLNGEESIDLKMVDSLIYVDEVVDLLKSRVGGSSKLRMITLGDYIKVANSSVNSVSSENKIALVYVDGSIVDRYSGEGTISSSQFVRRLERARKDDDVKGVVVRVNSPGGSALASEVMWREVELVRREKPVIVSFGSVAASGGYYLSAPADVIVTNRATITGSIGVFGIMFNAKRGMNDLLGITSDVVKSNASADMGVPYRALSSHERYVMQSGVEDVYKTFVDHVAEGRNLTPSRVDEIGQGRVWSGINAKEIGLADTFGGIRSSLLIAADKSGVIDDFEVEEFGDEVEPFMQLLNSFMSVKSGYDRMRLGTFYESYSLLNRVIKQGNTIQVWMAEQYNIQ